MMATNFEEFVHKIAEEAPHLVILDWYRRLDFAVRDYRKAVRVRMAPRETQEAMIARDPLLGTIVAKQLTVLRTTRNKVAHTGITVSSDTAIAYARQCFALIGVIGKAQDSHTA
jgi:hypothetical protein